MPNSMVIFTSSVFDRKTFKANLVQNIKTVSLTWNFVLRLIQIRRIQWWCSLFCYDWEYPFWLNVAQKIKIFSLNWNLVPKITWICKILWWCSLFLFSTSNICPFWANMVQKIKISRQLTHRDAKPVVFLVQSKDERSHTNSSHFGLPGCQSWSVIRKFSFKL